MARTTTYPFSSKKITYLDDSLSTKQQLACIQGFQSKDIDILLAKPNNVHLLPKANRSLIVIPDMDAWLQIPNFRIEERLLQWLAKLTSHAHLEIRNEIWIQTKKKERTPLHDLVTAIECQDTLGQCKIMLAEREKYHYPPYQKFLQITLIHSKIHLAQESSQKLLELLEQSLGQAVTGPFPFRRMYEKTHAGSSLLVRLSLQDAPFVKKKIWEQISNLKGQTPYKQVKICFQVDI